MNLFLKNPNSFGCNSVTAGGTTPQENRTETTALDCGMSPMESAEAPRLSLTHTPGTEHKWCIPKQNMCTSPKIQKTMAFLQI